MLEMHAHTAHSTLSCKEKLRTSCNLNRGLRAHGYMHSHRVMKNKPSMSQMVLPRTLPPEQEECAREIAQELGLKTEKVLCSGCIVNK